MSTNFVQEGDTLTLTAPDGGVASSVPVVIGAIFAVPIADAEAGEDFAARVRGVYEIAKSSNAFSAGQLAYWDKDNSLVTSTATNNKLIGFAVQAAGTSDTMALIRLDGVAR